MTISPYAIRTFRPSRLWLNPHAQTIVADMWRSTSGIIFQRERLETPDGDFVDVDFPTFPGTRLTAESPLVLVLHGLEGSARRSYACELYRQLAAQGIRSAGLNYRSCSGELNRTARHYHSGATDDVALVIEWLQQRYPAAPMALVGFSLGGSLTLKYLGERGDATPIRAAVSISPPFDLARGAAQFDHAANGLYGRRFVRSLRTKIEAKADLLAEHVDLERVFAASSVRQFDEAFTAPLHGFSSAAEYYELNSPKRFISGIEVPTLLLRAYDDPFFAHDIPHRRIAANRWLFPGFTAHGGHVGFVEGTLPRSFRHWAHGEAVRFLQQFLCSGNKGSI